jgi:hypothetical protein
LIRDISDKYLGLEQLQLQNDRLGREGLLQLHKVALRPASLREKCFASSTLNALVVEYVEVAPSPPLPLCVIKRSSMKPRVFTL